MLFPTTICISLLLHYQCEADSCLPTLVSDGSVSVCDTTDGQCKCGAAKNNACTSGGTQPKCLVTTTGVAPTSEADTANCQVI